MGGAGSRKKREDERKSSLDALARIASQAQGPPITPPKETPRRPSTREQRPPKPRPDPRERPGAPLEGRAAEAADRRAWQARRERELAEAARLAGPAAESPTPADPEAAARARASRARAEERRMRRESLKELQEQRKQALLRGGTLERRGPWMKEADVPSGVRRSPFAPPPSLDDKITHVLGEPVRKPRESSRERERKRRRG